MSQDLTDSQRKILEGSSTMHDVEGSEAGAQWANVNPDTLSAEDQFEERRRLAAQAGQEQFQRAEQTSPVEKNTIFKNPFKRKRS